MPLHFYVCFHVNKRYSYHLYSAETQAISRSLLVLDSSTKILSAFEHIDIKDYRHFHDKQMHENNIFFKYKEKNHY